VRGRVDALDNSKAAVSLFTAWDNFCRVDQTFRVTAAMKSRLSDQVWSMERVSGLLG